MPDYSKTKIQFRRGLAAEFEAVNPILASGEPAFAEGIFKIGNGESDWGTLPEVGGSSSNKVARSVSLTDTSIENYIPSVLADVVAITSATGDVTIKSIASTYSRKQFILVNDTESVNIIKLVHNDLTQAAANRIHASPNSDIVLAYGHSAILTYDAGEGRWIGQKLTSQDIQTISNVAYVDLQALGGVDPNTIYVVT
jgi:hypothetical protein